MVQIANFERPCTATTQSQQIGNFTVVTFQLYGGSIFHQVLLPIENQQREVALFADQVKHSLVDTLRIVHDLVFLWIPPVTDPRGLIMSHRDQILDQCKEQVRLLVGGGSWLVRHFQRVDESPQTTLHLSRYHDPVFDRIITMAVGTPAMVIDSADSVDTGQGTGIVRVSPSWIDPGPFTLNDQHYGKTDYDVVTEQQAIQEALAEKNKRA